MDEILSTVNAEPEQTVDARITGQAETAASGNGEVANSAVDTKPVQTPEENAHFAEQRRAREAAEARASKAERDRDIARTYGRDYEVFSEEDIAAKYGHLDIKTVDQLKAAIEKQEKEAALRERGIDPNALENEVNEHPEVKEARELKQRNKVYAEFESWHKDNKEGLPDLDKLPRPVVDAFLKGESMVNAFMSYEYQANKAAKAKEAETAKIQEANDKTASSSTGSVKANGAISQEYFTKEQVASMSTEEVRNNYEKICKSTSKW